MSANIEIIIGTYEEFLLGYKFYLKDGSPLLLQSFADKSHSGSIRCLAIHERWIASGGADDRIFIYDMSTRKQSQILLSHEGTINSIAFSPDGTHLLSAGEDGRMIATRLKTWLTEATWKKAHNGSPVTHISCHPSGKLALSLGSDLVLRTWNLIKGRVAYKTNLKSRNTLGGQLNCLVWSPTGDYFAISGQRVVEFWSIKSANVLRSQKTKSKPICLTWICNDACLVGLEDGKLIWLSIESEEEKEIVAHNARVKAICAFKDSLVTASSSGEIKLWQIIENEHQLKEIATTNIGCRPTCVNILDLEQFGANYVITDTLEVNNIKAKPTTLKSKVPQRGVVTIKYDDEDEEGKKEDEDQGVSENDDTGEDVENEADSVAEDDDDLNYNDGKENDDETDSFEEDGDDSNSEPEIHLPKSRKHKLQIVKKKENEKKKQKVDNNKLQNNKKQKEQTQQKKNKQKFKK